MTQDDKKQFDDLFDTFETEGWKLIEKEAGNEYDNLLQVLATENDETDIYRIQGKLAVLYKMKNFKELAHNTYEQLLEAESEEESDADV